MLTMGHMTAFSDELRKIASHKVANLSMQPTQSQVDAPPPRALGVIKQKSPKSTINSKNVPSYSKVHSVPTPAPMASYQPSSAAPAVRS